MLSQPLLQTLNRQLQWQAQSFDLQLQACTAQVYTSEPASITTAVTIMHVTEGNCVQKHAVLR